MINLNKEYDFQKCRKHFSIYNYVNSKKKLNRFDPRDSVIYHIENNIDNFKNNFESILNNRKIYSCYEQEYNKITDINHTYSEKIIGKEFKTIEKFIKFEKKLIDKIKYKNDFELSVHVKTIYTSPKGQNSYRKERKFSFSDILSCYEQYNKNKNYQISARYERSIMTDSLRYDILKRDNYRCQICGISAKDGAKLHVDHIVPVSKGGKTRPNNLQTLCERCNLGKSNKN